MPTVRIDITDPSGAHTTQLVSGERILVGSASHCDVLLPVELAAPEHALIEVVADSVRVTSRAEPAVTIDGSSVIDGVVRPESLLGIGGVTLRLSTGIDADGNESRSARSHSRSSTGLRIALMGGIVACIAVLLMAHRPGGPAPSAVPELWTSSPSVCSTHDVREAAQIAQSKEIVASAKRERHPFHLADGVEAVELFEVSAACLGVAGNPQHASDLKQLAAELREEIDGDYRVRRLRLEYALRRDDTSTVANEVTLLRELLRGKRGEYVSWLDTLARSVKPEPKKQGLL